MHTAVQVLERSELCSIIPSDRRFLRGLNSKIKHDCKIGEEICRAPTKIRDLRDNDVKRVLLITRTSAFPSFSPTIDSRAVSQKMLVVIWTKRKIDLREAVLFVQNPSEPIIIPDAWRGQNRRRFRSLLSTLLLVAWKTFSTNFSRPFDYIAHTQKHSRTCGAF